MATKVLTAKQRQAYARLRDARHGRVREAFRKAAASGCVPSQARCDELQSNIPALWRLERGADWDAGIQGQHRAARPDGYSDHVPLDRVQRDMTAVQGVDWSMCDQLQEWN